MNRFGKLWSGALVVLSAALFIGPASSLYAQQGEPEQALELERAGKNTEAEAAWRVVAQREPRNAEAFAHLGLVQARQDHYADAVTSYRRALALNPALPGLELNLGLALFKAQDFKGAIQPFTAALKEHPGDERIIILLGMAHYGMGDYLVAIPYLRRAADYDRTSLPLRLALAHSCMWSKQYQCVLDVYKQILALNADSAEADMLAGEALDQKGDSTGAIEQFRAAVKSNPKEPNAHFGLGYLLWTQSHYPEAAEQFLAELENDPNHAQARVYLGDCYVQTNQYDKAKPVLEKIVADGHAQAMVYRDLGAIYANEGRNEDAVRELKQAIALDAGDVTSHWRLARLYQAMGQKDEAKVEFQKASTLVKRDNNQTLYDKLASSQAQQASVSSK
ncbi:hypothetical protein GCM10011507_17460 [Edaphobacter acidisoli]|uniref:Tetratricopeptide repeat protein n=1 Tax=Edaphobacter acidisoli TaxID=2040573 RepID=A0A916W4Y6_9BACT|nr:tetratricopeptide repeat protein [Edaphobacter acidisoli]GGA66450.1 hypothetical protein GCM10011507_17460 [Edaphobacter acidisoli]